MTTVFVTGHRPASLDKDYTYKSDLWQYAASEFRKFLLGMDITHVFTGMALGFDQLAAMVAKQCGVPYTAAVPFLGQEKRWPTDGKQLYKRLLSRAAKVEIVSPGGYAAWKMQKRNEWLADNGDLGVALWNGKPGGTANCIQYAAKQHKPIWRIDPIARVRGWYRVD